MSARSGGIGADISGSAGYAIILVLIVASYALCAAQQGSDPSPRSPSW